MTRRSKPPAGEGTDGRIDRIETGLGLLFAADVAGDVLDAIDLEKLRAGEPVDRAVDVERLGGALGQPAGRLIARGLLRDVARGSLGGVIVREIAGQAGARAVRSAIERADGEAAFAALDPAVRRRPPDDAVHVEVTRPDEDAE